MRSPSAGQLRSIALATIALASGACGGAPSGSPSTPVPPSATPGTAVAPTPAATAQLLWAAPPDPMERTLAAGLQPEVEERLAYHVHAHLDVFVDGKPVLVPAGIGINTHDPDVHTFAEPDGSNSFGGIETCAIACISPLHTHFQTGIIHTESATPEPNTLGQFFIEWGVALTGSCVGELCHPKPIAVYVDGELFTGDPATIELTDRRQIAIVVGTPPALIPSTADFSLG